MYSTIYNKEQKLWCGSDIPPLYNPNISLAQALLNSMSLFGWKIAQISDNNGIRMTFDEMKIKTIRAAQNLMRLGCKPKDVFTLMARNSHHVAPITFASIAIGCPVNTLDVSFDKTEVIHMLTITKPVLVFCDVQCYDLVDECLEELCLNAKIFTFGGSVGESEPVENLFKETRKETQFIPLRVDGSNDAAFMACSSGTTGLPKCVCLSHAAFLDSMSQHGVDSSHVMLALSSLYWISGGMTLVRGTLFGATRIITTESFAPELQIRLIEQYKVTYISTSPHQTVLMMKSNRFNEADFTSLKYYLMGGSKVLCHIKDEMNRFLPNGSVHCAYGMSETAGPISFDDPTVHENDTVGRLMGGCFVKIIDEQGNRLGVNEDGEIYIKMNYKFLGYYGNLQATAEVIDGEGFIASEDIGHFDNHGNLFITGRRKEFLEYCSFPIVPSEIDAYLTESSDIQSACVVGIPDPMGHLPAAVVVRNGGSTICENNVFDMVAGHFADHYKLRGGVYFVDSLPTTPSGKLLRRKVTETAIELFNARKS